LWLSFAYFAVKKPGPHEKHGDFSSNLKAMHSVPFLCGLCGKKHLARFAYFSLCALRLKKPGTRGKHWDFSSNLNAMPSVPLSL